MHEDDNGAREGAIKIRVPADPDFAEMFGATAERLWAVPTGEPRVYRVDNIPMFTDAVRRNDLVRVGSKAGAAGIFGVEEVVKRSGHVTFQVIVARDDHTVEPRTDPLLAPLWNAWARLERLGCAYEGGKVGSAYILAIDAPTGADLDAVRAILDEGEAADHWGWAGGAEPESGA